MDPRVLFIFVLSCLFGLTGCVTNPPVVVEKTTYEAVGVSKQLLTPFEAPILFTRQEYLSMTDDNRRRVMLSAIVDRNAVIESCNARLFSIETESQKIKERIEQRNKNVQ